MIIYDNPISDRSPSTFFVWEAAAFRGSYFNISGFQALSFGRWERLVPLMQKLANGDLVKIMAARCVDVTSDTFCFQLTA